MVVDPLGFQVYKSTAGNVSAEQTRSAGAARFEKYEKTMDEKLVEEIQWSTVPHMKNFLETAILRISAIVRDVHCG
jgi:hypothetical protein